MELHQIRYFLAVCEAGSVIRAAELRNVAQPSLTRAVKKLEGELGGMGISVMPERLPIYPQIGTRPLIDSEVRRTVSLVTTAGRCFTPAVEAFVRLAPGGTTGRVGGEGVVSLACAA